MIGEFEKRFLRGGNPLRGVQIRSRFLQHLDELITMYHQSLTHKILQGTYSKFALDVFEVLMGSRSTEGI